MEKESVLEPKRTGTGPRPPPMIVELQLQRETVRRIMDQATDRNCMKNAVDMVRYHAENYIRELTEKADIVAETRDSRTIQERDIAAAKKLL